MRDETQLPEGYVLEEPGFAQGATPGASATVPDGYVLESAAPTNPPPANYIEDQSGFRVEQGQGTSFIAQPATGKMVTFDPGAEGKERTRMGTVPGFGGGSQTYPTDRPPTEPVQTFQEPTPQATEMMGLPPAPPTSAPMATMTPPPAGPSFRGPYTAEEKNIQAMGEKPLAGKAQEYAAGGGFLANYVEKPILGMIGKTLGGKIGRNLANTAELALHPERYYSLVTGERKAPTQVEIKNAALNMGLLSSGSPLLNTLAQDLPGFAVGGDAIIASVPWIGLPLMNLQHQLLDNQLTAQEGKTPQWDVKSLGESAVMGLAFQLPLPKFLAQGEGGVTRRLAQQFGGAGLRALEMAAGQAATGKQPTYEDFLNNFALMAGMKFPEAIQQVTAGRAVSKLVENGLDKQAANSWVNAAMQGDARAEGMVRKYINDKVLAKEMGDAANFARDWRERNTAAQDAETVRQKDLAERARHGDKAAQAELARARGIGVNPEAAAEEAKRAQGGLPYGAELRRAEGLTPILGGAATIPVPGSPVAGQKVPRGAGIPPVAPPIPVQPVPVPPAPVAGPKINIPARQPNNQTHIIQSPLEPNKTAEGYYAWVDLNDPAVQASRQNNASTDLQGRNRDRQAYLVSRADRLQKFDVTRTADSQTSDYGSPIIDLAEGKPVAGYGRMDTLEDVYNLPDADPRKQALINYQNDFAPHFGLGPRPPEMQRPFLARIVESYSPNTDAADFAKESNRTVAEQMSDAELAMSDAKMILNNKLLDVLNVSESGELINKDNKDFINRYMDGIQNRSPLTDSKGALINEKVNTRLQRALLTILMQENPQAVDVVTALTERAGEYGLTDTINGLAAAAPSLVRLKSLNPVFDLTPEISATMPVIMEAKRALLSGESKSLEAYFGQLDFYRQATPEQQKLVMILVQAKSAKWLREVLRAYATIAEKMDQKTMDMFAGALPESKKIDISPRFLNNDTSLETIILHELCQHHS